MAKRILLVVLCLVAPALARAADVQLGTVTLKLDPPAGQCALDPAQSSDKRMIDFITTALANGGIDLLGINADCSELGDWRAGKQQLLKHFTQYQTGKAFRATDYSAADAAAACTQMRAQGAKLSTDAITSANDSIHKANKNIDVQGQTFLGVLADDPNGCFVGLFQKFKAETGAVVTQLNVFFMGTIKGRSVNFYVWGPMENDNSISGLLQFAQNQIAKVKAANGV